MLALHVWFSPSTYTPYNFHELNHELRADSNAFSLNSYSTQPVSENLQGHPTAGLDLLLGSRRKRILQHRNWLCKSNPLPFVQVLDQGSTTFLPRRATSAKSNWMPVTHI